MRHCLRKSLAQQAARAAELLCSETTISGRICGGQLLTFGSSLLPATRNDLLAGATARVLHALRRSVFQPHRHFSRQPLQEWASTSARQVVGIAATSTARQPLGCPQRCTHFLTRGSLQWRSYHVAARQCAWQLPGGLRRVVAKNVPYHTRPLHWSSQWREGWSSFRSIFDLPYEYVVGGGYSARVAVINALYAMHPHWAKMTAVLLAERLTRGDRRFAWCYSMPVTEFEDLRDTELHLEEQGLLRRAWNFVRSLLRLLWLILVFTPAVMTAPVVFGYDIHRKRWLVMFRRTLERGGPAFIKWGQWAATRRDLFPPDMCRELEKLHTQAPAHEMPHTEAAIREAFGFGIEDLFSYFECRPVASGSIGQIHRAVFSDTGARLTGVDEGTLVAVKVRHPGVSEVIERDFALMMWVAALAGRLPPLQSLRLEESLKQFAAPLREQVDLGREACHLHAFNYNFRKLRKSVSFPVPLYPLAAPQCLVETYEPGEHISRYVARGAGAPFNSELAVLGARTMLHMMLVDNLIHADLHPGNILVQLKPMGGKPGEKLAGWAQGVLSRLGDVVGKDLTIPAHWYLRPRMVLLDAGMATHLSDEDQRNMVGLFEAFSALDGRCLGDWVLRFSGEEQSCPDPEGFKRDLASFFGVLKEQRLFDKGDSSNGAEALSHVLDMVRRHQVSLPGHICATVVTTLVLEGWSFELDPKHSTLSEVQRMTKAFHETWWGRWLVPVADDEVLNHMTHAGSPGAVISA